MMTLTPGVRVTWLEHVALSLPRQYERRFGVVKRVGVTAASIVVTDTGREEEVTRYLNALTIRSR